MIHSKKIEVFHGQIDKQSITFIQKNINVVHYSHNPEYLCVVTNFEHKSTPYYFMIKHQTSYVYYQFIIREIDSKIFNIQYYDIVAPFDYGEYHNNNTELLDSFFKTFHAFCLNKNIISEFIRFNPMLTHKVNLLEKHMNISFIQDHIYMDLTIDYVSSFSKRKIRNIKKAQKYDYQFIENDTIENFYLVYVNTMKRIKANSYFYFEQSALKSLLAFGKIFSIKYDDKIISSIFILEDIDIIYYFLGGTHAKYIHLGFNSLLFKLVANYYTRSKKMFFLSGGKNGLYTYKQEFSSLTKPYYIGKKIYNELIYKQLTIESSRVNNDFFPQYREKII